MDYQWYPGHMTKAKRMMQENIRLVDLVIEIVDARIPVSSRNPDIDALCEGKGRILVMSKADLADRKATGIFTQYYEQQGFTVAPVDSRDRQSASIIRNAVQKASKAKREKDLKRGIKNRPVRAMVCGIPNVGKSTLINSIAGQARAKTGNKPGVTKGKQWVSMKLGTGGGAFFTLELLDTPGILWPKFEDANVGLRLALTGSIREEILDEQELSMRLLRFLREHYPQVIPDRYGSAAYPLLPEENDNYEDPKAVLRVMEQIAANRNYLLKGGEPDLKRCAHQLLDDFKNGRTGRITLDDLPGQSVIIPETEE
ncbi:MAG TPA: ribosome biogenesis GTPase YlqF [Lachnospiraceae bacterium]|jgi:ribosome biogenesis GTPase A|nr:ribosome biogenesis GTPase YlqF [Lachnospiraceae bacterium]HAK18579.1 ribosome biogenesis GTPase YlqF [Lachnospiraceae bacterium]HAP72965.1 ribosome biogenesis GTPase YlqF [Lachnospiraceae bacterium]HBH70828.1 ribosome biogenesis GTPase YlqF [Lachnospiraceae bacterium]